MRVNRKELYLPRKIKVQQAASTAAILLRMEGYEVTELYLYETFINWLGLRDCDVAALVVEMIDDHKKVVKNIELIEQGC